MGNIFSRAKEFLCATVEPDPKSFRVDPASTNFPISLMSIHQELKRDSQILSKPDTEFDYSIRPQDSLYDFVNNKWIENAKLPENKSIINPINQLRDETRIKIESLIVPDLSDPLSMFVADFYNSGMNVDQHQADNSHISTINEIMNSNCTESIIRIHTDLYLKGLSGGFFGIQVLPDFKNSTIMIGAIESSGLLMPTRDYYIEDDKRNLRLKYMKYLSTLFDSFGVSADPTLVLSFEIALAKVSLTQNEQRDLGAIYNIFETSDIIRQFSNIPFQLFFEHLGININDSKSFIVDNPKYYETLSELFKSQSIETLKTYLLAHYLTKQAQFLNDKFRKIHFDFFSTKLMGQLEQSPISEQVLRIMSTVFKNPLGQLFARRYFSEDSKQQVLEMIEYIVNSFRDRLTRIDWMSPQTRKNAIEKLNAIKFKIGYPDIYRDCSNLYKEMSSLSSFTLKFSLLQRHEFQHQISLIGKQPDPNEWEIEAYTVNAAYLPLSNEICFPAAFIQSPIYNQPTASNSYIAENFGALGTVIAHELTHGLIVLF